jgi:hypothetical protein
LLCDALTLSDVTENSAPWNWLIVGISCTASQECQNHRLDLTRQQFPFARLLTNTVCSASGSGGGVVLALVVEVMIVNRKTKNVLTYCSRNKHQSTVLEHSFYTIIVINSYTGQPGSG